MVKDGNVMHKFNKNLLFTVGLTILLLIAGGVFYGLTKKQKPVEVKIDESAVKTDDLAKVEDAELGDLKPLREADQTDHLLGDANAKVKLVIYDDFECPYCADYYDTLEKVKQEFGDKISIAFRHFPLTSIHPNSMSAAIASECAAEQGKFWEMYQKLFAANKSGSLNADQFKKDAVAMGLDQNKFNQCLDSEKYRTKIEEQITEATSIGVTGAPTTFVNKEIVIGANPFEDGQASDGSKIEGLKNIINRHLNK